MLYVMHNADVNRVKIGVTTDINQRAKTIENQGGFVVDVLFVSDAIKNPFEIERKLHSHFGKHRHIGEWFNVDSELATNTAKRFIGAHGKVISDVVKYNEYKRKITQSTRDDDYEVDYCLNISKFKRIKPNIYSDKKGKLYSIKFRLSDGAWMIRKL